MILDDHNQNMTADHNDNPPAYEFVAPAGEPSNHVDDSRVVVADKPPRAPSQPQSPVYVHGHSPPIMHQPTVYHYMNPRTGDQLASLLPPDHPEMICLQQGGHVPQAKYGLLGILAAIVWFPLGIGLCLLDRRVKCKRCGYMIDEGMCS
ncbi:hypothetical protein BJ138DRAFT_1124355 [Hygrophoropsis aurantiaca]|uniref:Uncharacterized protein n=1 Tax=Hygrophoropsis aurantiaca TaxID=72124 RepID=A0ACB8AJQ5_9AGAM|nr:hypothetical protein BJ138DRAFT_1124355 [Hygrophoropsis aurantiaca]